MKVIEDIDKKITVEVCYTHYGHTRIMGMGRRSKGIKNEKLERPGKRRKTNPTMQQENISKCHQASLKLSTDLVSKADDDSKYVVRSPNGKIVYNVVMINETCPESSCYLKCVDCGVCAHIFMCSCPDSLVRNNMCKHIHLVRRCIQRDSDSSLDDDVDGIEECGDSLDAELEEIAETNECYHLREEIKSYCDRIRTLIEDCNDVQPLIYLKQQLNGTLNTFQFLQRQDTVRAKRTTSSAPTN